MRFGTGEIGADLSFLAPLVASRVNYVFID